MTRGDIITDALNRAARPDLISDARLWLNLILERCYLNYDFDWLVKSQTLPVVQGLGFPSDYRASKSAMIKHGGGLLFAEVFSDPARYDHLRSQYYNSTSKPKYIWADHSERVFQFIPAPNEVYELQIKYYHIPELPDPSDTGSDLLTPTWALPNEVLIQALKLVVYDYNEDDRFERAAQFLESEIIKGKMNNHDFRASTSRMSMGKSFRKRF